VVNSIKLSIGIIIIVLFAAGIGIYLSEFPSSPQPTKVHNFQVKVNDTLAIGEKHG